MELLAHEEEPLREVKRGSDTGQMLVKPWSNAGQILVKHCGSGLRARTGQPLCLHGSNTVCTGQTRSALVKHCLCWSNTVCIGQTLSVLVKHCLCWSITVCAGQTLSAVVNHCPYYSCTVCAGQTLSVLVKQSVLRLYWSNTVCTGQTLSVLVRNCLYWSNTARCGPIKGPSSPTGQTRYWSNRHPLCTGQTVTPPVPGRFRCSGETDGETARE